MASAGLDDETVHLWVFRFEPSASPELLHSDLELLSSAERARYAEFRHPVPRDEYLRARVFTRTVLARYANLAPQALEFVEGERGRPELEHLVHGRRLRFNLSHTRGFMALLVGWDIDLGVDVEDSTRPGDPLRLAESVFAPGELAALTALSPGQRLERFFVYWTLKEAYIKARGLGLTLPLELFSFVVDDPAAIRVRLDPALEDDARGWQFAHFRPSLNHHLALGLRVGQGPRRRILWRGNAI